MEEFYQIYLKKTEKTQSVTTGKFSNNFRADVEALKTTAEMMLSEMMSSEIKRNISLM